jgi:hypothetical protein
MLDLIYESEIENSNISRNSVDRDQFEVHKNKNEN